MTKYMRNGSAIMVKSDNNMPILEALPGGTYTVRYNPEIGYYLDTIDDYSIGGKIYGDTKERAERILRTFASRDAATGVMLSGEQGSGKTMLAKMLSVIARDSGIPTIVINSPMHGEGFNQFIQTIDQECVVIFDEFEKVYDSDDQESMLTLLDGVYPTKKLFVLTLNKVDRINSYMKNRPGRLFYHLKYSGLDGTFVQEYAEDNLVDKSYVDAVVRLSLAYGGVNFDVLKALIEEMNRYNESPKDAMRFLNVTPKNNGNATHSVVKLVVNGVSIPIESVLWHGNPFTDSVSLEVDLDDLKAKGFGYSIEDFVVFDTDDTDNGYTDITFGESKLVGFDAVTGRFEYKDGDNSLVMVRKADATPDYDWAF